MKTTTCQIKPSQIAIVEWNLQSLSMCSLQEIIYLLTNDKTIYHLSHSNKIAVQDMQVS